MRPMHAVLAGLVLTACAGTTQFQGYPDLDPRTTPTATIHVIRENSIFGNGVTAPVYVDRYLIGRLGPGGHLATRVPVGRVHVTSTTADVVIQTEKDTEYFFQVSMPAQLWLYAPSFDISEIKKQAAGQLVRHDPTTR